MNTQGESSTSSHFSYDVFLSFRGEDTRKNFTGHLYSRLCQVGVNTFIDDEELKKGDVISTKLEKAIQESKVSIVVFSRNYASSSWCLDELVKILECKEKLKQVVLPIFYDVDPSQVRKQNGCFGEALAMLKERSFGAQRMDKWTTALTEAANLSGWNLRNIADGHESRFIESIIKQVLQEVNQTPLDVAWHPVGVDSRVKHIELLLQNGCEKEVRMVGIYGVGGIGKTTLAKAMYNRIFRYFGSSCFLLDVKSEAEAFGLVKLQEKLLHQILKTKDIKVSSTAEGVNLIKARLGSKKVLIILDDVDHIRQLESLTRERSWFGSGSLIIITTRDEHLLYGLRENERYKAKLLNYNEARQLFSCHAFNSLSPPPEYVELSQDIIKYSGGLPLALVTLGSHLQGRSVEEWRYELKKLRAIPHIDIQKILKISFDGLDCDTQSVFLDIACALHGFDSDEVADALNACGFYFESAIATLVKKCLLQNAWSLVMHDLVRDMGKEIVRTESPRDPGKRSRLFNPQEVCDVLQGNKGSKKIEVLMVDSQALKGVNLSTNAFKKMINLRVLIIDGKLSISGNFELLSKELRWLSWKGCPLKCISSNFSGDKLVVLDMRESDIQEFGLNFQCCKSLKKLDLSDSKRLKRTPNFNGSRSLETLWLHGCSSLTEIHPSIGNLDGLIDLDFSGCKKLTDLPSSICRLKSLETLDICRCSSLQTLPVDLGDMRCLKSLAASDTGIKQLPRSVEMLKDLENLDVGGKYIEAKRSFSRRRVHRIQSFSTFLSFLVLKNCGFSEVDIPRDIGSLSSLWYLDLSGNSFRRLPFDFSNLQSLMILHLNGCENLQILPSVSNLQRLFIFEIANCKKLVNITGLDNLPSLSGMSMLNCTSLQNPFNEGFFSAHALAFPSMRLEIYLQSNEIPHWCNNQVTSSSICFTMPTHNKEYTFLGMILACVRKFANIPTSRGFHSRGLSFNIAGKMSSRGNWVYDYVIPDGQAELLCVLYIPFLEEPFDCPMKGGEQIQITEMQIAEIGEECTVKKIGIHLLYLDQHGKVTSLPKNRGLFSFSDNEQKPGEQTWRNDNWGRMGPGGPGQNGAEQANIYMERARRGVGQDRIGYKALILKKFNGLGQGKVQVKRWVEYKKKKKKKRPLDPVQHMCAHTIIVPLLLYKM
ncbi:disease resistance protein RUN1-like isoform X2 [Lycium ferocissimum]|uniref:disease resistance protein RUN1-like isoform X2 n=1 Tax=Lycium ferocissimum TaxID=112874 RepID=UPI0028150F3C|nr:disease resistance protein RUN1-like isoform X2 [Lycium ferocissimum]